jgi:hypothetical protein
MSGAARPTGRVGGRAERFAHRPNAVDLPAKTVKMASEPVKVTAKTVAVILEPVEMTSKTVEVTSGTVKVGAKTVEVTSEPVEMTAKAVDMGFKTVKVLSEPVEIHLKPVGVAPSPLGRPKRAGPRGYFAGKGASGAAPGFGGEAGSSCRISCCC